MRHWVIWSNTVVILIGIEGAEGDANNPATGYKGSFIHRMVRNWPDKDSARYVPGPKVQAGGINSHCCGRFYSRYDAVQSARRPRRDPGGL
jgi:hypothetical protein